MRALVLADTHVTAAGKRQLPAAVRRALDEVEVVLHAGDVCEAWVLDELRAHAPEHAVLGNNDHGLHDVLPESRTLNLGGVSVALVHDSGARAGRERRMVRRFPGAAVVVFGHSHQPCNAWHDGQLLFNPGSATWKRTAPTHTYGLLTFDDGVVTDHAIVDC